MPERGDAADEGAEKIRLTAQRGRRDCIEDEALPRFRRGWNQTVLRAVEIFHALEFGHAFE